jgi:hypothetical protein
MWTGCGPPVALATAAESRRPSTRPVMMLNTSEATTSTLLMLMARD